MRAPTFRSEAARGNVAGTAGGRAPRVRADQRADGTMSLRIGEQLVKLRVEHRDADMRQLIEILQYHFQLFQVENRLHMRSLPQLQIMVLLYHINGRNQSFFELFYLY